MKRLVVTVVLVSCLARGWAMPTKAELTKAQPLVVELMAPAMEAYKSATAKDKTAAAVKVGDASSGFAKAAETESARFLLLKGAVNFYTRGEAYDKAADAVATLQATVKDVTPAVIAELTGKATSKISETKAPRLFAQYRAAKLQVRAAGEAKSLALKLKKVKSDAFQRRYAEALAVSGDWTKAYGEFAKLSDAKLKAVVEAEAKGKAKNAEAGEFWWAYEPEMEDAADFFKTHAATFYRQALAAGEITGLKKNIVEQRIKPYGESAEVAESASVVAVPPTADSAWQEKGNTAWLTLANGEKLEFAKCPAGTVNLRTRVRIAEPGVPNEKKVKISRPFWVMVRPLAVCNLRGYSVAMPDWVRKDESPVRYFEWNVDDILNFTRTITAKLKDCLPQGYVVRLPSFAEWDYSFHAGSVDPDDPYANFDVSRRKENIARCKECFFYGGCFGKYGDWYNDMKGKTKKNNWGLHDFCYEKLLDKVDSNNAISWKGEKPCDFDANAKLDALKIEAMDEVDPLLWSESDQALSVVRSQSAWKCLSCEREKGFTRLVVGPDLVSEWKAKQKAGGAAQVSAAASAPAAKVGSDRQEKGDTSTSEKATVAVKPTGNPIVLNLTRDLAMEFVPCPAGEFEMGNSAVKESPSYRHKVKITRPFWIGEYQVTREIWQQFSSDLRLNEVKLECGGMKAPMTDMSYQHVEEFCNWLQHRYSGKVKMPKGYVFRLPTEAEWEYALDAGGDPKDDYHRWLDGDDSLRSKIMITKDDYQKIIDKTKVKFPKLYACPSLIVGQKKPNAWGVFDMLGNGSEFVLDCVSNIGYQEGRPSRSLMGTDILRYEEEEVDPLRYRTEPKQAKGKKVAEGEGRCMLIRNYVDKPSADWYAKGRGGTRWGYGMNSTFRLVIGPDLVSEWKAKHGKK